MWRVYYTQMQQDPRFGPYISRVNSRSGWAFGVAALAGLLVVVIPLILLALAGLFVAVVTFAVLTLVSRLVDGVQSIFGSRRDVADPFPTGRRNVRVIDGD